VTRRLVVSAQSEADIEEIALYIACDDVVAATRFVDACFRAFDDLLRMPGMGSSRTFENPSLRGIRSWPVHGFDKHLIFYRATAKGIEVIRVVHGARDIDDAFDS
jgi:toxin ParE1/3/4